MRLPGQIHATHSDVLSFYASLDPAVTASRLAAWVFLAFAAPISAYVFWTDLRDMRIPNRAVLLLFACFLIAGPVVLPLDTFAWRIVQAAVVLAIGFVLNLAGGIGAGDVKFAAAAAPLVAPGDGALLLILFAAVLMAALVTHRLFRLVPAARGLTPDWVSWTRRDFPMGLALTGALVFYLALAVRYGADLV